MSSRSLARGSLAVLVGMMVRQGGIIVAFGILSRALLPADYGQFQRAWMIGLAISSVAALGIPQSMQFFIPRLLHQRQRRRLFLQSILLLQLGGLVGGILAWLLAEPISIVFTGDADYAPILRRYWIVIPFLAYSAQAGALFTSIERPKLAGYVNIGSGLAMAGALGLAALVTTRLDLLFIVQAVTMGAVTVAGTIAGYAGTYGRTPGPGEADDQSHALVGVGRQLAYAFPLIGSAVLNVAGLLIAKALVSNVYTADEFAVFANGAVEIPIGTILVAAVFGVVQPHLNRAYAARETGQMLRLIHQGVQNVALFVFPMGIFLAAFSRPFMVVLFGPTYAASGVIFLIFSIGMLPRVYSPYNLVNATGRPRWLFWLSLVSVLLNVVMAWAGLVLWGMVGCAAGTIASRLVSQAFFAWVSARALGTSFASVMPWKWLGKVLLACLASAGVGGLALLLPLGELLQLATGAAVFGGLYLLLGIRTGIISSSHMGLLKGMLNRRAPAPAGAPTEGNSH